MSRGLARLFLTTSALFMLTAAAHAQTDSATDPDEPGVAGRPENFSQVVGAYDLSARATPTSLHVEDPLILKVQITGTGPAAWRPQRSRLRLFPAEIERNFHIKPLPERDRYQAAEKTWEFFWELRPRRLGVKRIPALELAYYDPSFRRYQTALGSAIPLTVREQPQATPPEELTPAWRERPEWHQLVTGPEVLRRQAPSRPSLPLLIVLIVAPPLLCACWYVLWRRCLPDERKLARQRRSQAAERALIALGALNGESAERVSFLVTAYLRERLDLGSMEPTPREAARHLRRLGASSAIARQTAELFRSCDTQRFSPAPAARSKQLAGQAHDLIIALESESWRP
jgi:hypothetical protein